MLADETTPVGTLVRFFDDPDDNRRSRVHPLCGMRADGQFFHDHSGETGLGHWNYAVVVDSEGNYDEALLQSELARKKATKL